MLTKVIKIMEYTHSEIQELLALQGTDRDELHARAAAVKNSGVGNRVYLRGLIEYSNRCRKNCLYCGIRRDAACARYTLSKEQVLTAARYAYENRYGSVVLQGGENVSEEHIAKIEELVRDIKQIGHGALGITLSFGEQTLKTYGRWFEAGAHRYLLRIESSNKALYEKIHPQDSIHSYETRMQALRDLRTAGYQVGTGVMIGLPFQTLDDLASDLLFMQKIDIDMCGMGPYVVCKDTPLEQYASTLLPAEQRLELTLNMIAVLRLLMPDINIAATTALQSIASDGRIRAIHCGANVIMPNITPEDQRANYALYDHKPLYFDSLILEECVQYDEWGDSVHFRRRTK